MISLMIHWLLFKILTDFLNLPNYAPEIFTEMNETNFFLSI